MSRFLSRLLRFLFTMAFAAACSAQAQSPAQRLQAAAAMAKDLSFPTEVSSFSIFSSPRMALYKPEGPGPFPALVLQHQCGGLRNGRWTNESMLEWTRTAVARGYVALLVDSLGPRGAESVCEQPAGGVNFMRGVRDVLQAAAHVRSMPFVDGRRVALAGYSWGGMVGVLASSRTWGEALASGERFAAVVAFYPGCFTIRPPSGASYDIVRTDIDRPLLVLMGERDTETPPSECVPRLEEARAAGAPVQWHVYPGITHCWDCRNLHGFRKVDARRTAVQYLYDEATTQDAGRRMFEFLAQHLGP